LLFATATTLRNITPSRTATAACAVHRRAVRGGAGPARQAARRAAKLIKVYTWFAHWCAGVEKVFSKFTCQFAFDGEKFTLLSKNLHQKLRISKKKFTLMKKSLH
jgi:hypothetical protein